MRPHSTTWLCSQIGAREHYAIPRVLFQQSRLSGLWTDYWARPGSLWALLGGGRGRGRFHPALAHAPVRGFNLSWLVVQAAGRLHRNGESEPYDGFLRIGRWFSRQTVSALSSLPVDWEDTLFFGYDTGFLEAATWVKDRGGKCVLGQMDPGRVEMDLVAEEAKRWSGWETRRIEVPESYLQRREAEWKVADRIVVNSKWSFNALVQQGVPSEKMVIIPLAYEPDAVRSSIFHLPSSRAASEPASSLPAPRSQISAFNFQFSAFQPLRVLFLGQVILRKGIQYLIQAAHLLERENVRFDVVGPIGISDDALKTAPRSMTFHGGVSRDQATEWYQNADVFVLPTLSDGFAITQIEAMSHGLPVVATPCCGEVVTDGEDGFIMPPKNSEALADAISHYLRQADLLGAHQGAARRKAGQFTLDQLAEHFLALEADLTASR